MYCAGTAPRMEGNEAKGCGRCYMRDEKMFSEHKSPKGHLYEIATNTISFVICMSINRLEAIKTEIPFRQSNPSYPDRAQHLIFMSVNNQDFSTPEPKRQSEQK